MVAKRPKLKQRIAKAVIEHPRWTLGTLISIGTLIGLIVGGATWVASFFVWKADFTSHIQHDALTAGWHEVGHINLRVERLGDAVDELRTRKLVQGRLSASDEASLQLWQKKLDAAAAQLIEAQKSAKAMTREKP